MNRQEAIQRIIWSLLAHADAPREAVGAALVLKPQLGISAEGDFRNLLRAAGLFARDDDGFFVRYVRRNSKEADEERSSLPSPTHLLTVPVPVEPRMRIAYSVFTGLLLKHLYQCHSTVPLQVTEGMALLWAPERPSPPASPLPDNPAGLWNAFQQSKLAEEALRDGIEATLTAVRNIGAIAVSDSLARTPLLRVLLDVLPRYERKFQAQGGMRLDFYSEEDIDTWRQALQLSGSFDGETVKSVWAGDVDGADPGSTGRRVAALIVKEAFDAKKAIAFRTLRGLWHGEGKGKNRKPGQRDLLGPSPRSEAGERAAPIDEAIDDALDRLERRRRTSRDLDRRIFDTLKKRQDFSAVVHSLASQIAQDHAAASATVSAGMLVDAAFDTFRQETLTTFLRKGEAQATEQARVAVTETCRNIVAWTFARKTVRDDVAIFGWPLTVLRSVPEESRFALRFIKKMDSPGAKKIVTLDPLGDISSVAVAAAAPPPFSLEPLGASSDSSGPTERAVSSGARCIVCGSSWDLLSGAISFVPESKKRWYESPTSFVEPKLCSNCAFVAYLSAIYPNSDVSVVEFPADNFLELFALHEHLQGISGAVALKSLNRVATLAVLPSRYLLLSRNSRQGRMDSKTQIYVQLGHHTPLLRDLDRPMRVQSEGNQPNFWSEALPHVAVGLSHFARLPGYYETGDRKVVAQRVVRSLTAGRPFGALYLVTQTAKPESGFGHERSVLARGLTAFEGEFVGTRQYGDALAQALGGTGMSGDLFGDVIEFSNYLLGLCQPLVRREVRASRSAVSGIARKFTDLIAADFAQCHAANFLYVTCQKADQAEKTDAWWLKRDLFSALYPTAKSDAQIREAQARRDEATVAYETAENELKLATDLERGAKEKALKDADARLLKAWAAVGEAWDAFRGKHPKTELESRLESLYLKHGQDTVIWRKLLREVEARTLALLLLNVHRAS